MVKKVDPSGLPTETVAAIRSRYRVPTGATIALVSLLLLTGAAAGVAFGTSLFGKASLIVGASTAGAAGLTLVSWAWAARHYGQQGEDAVNKRRYTGEGSTPPEYA